MELEALPYEIFGFLRGPRAFRKTIIGIDIHARLLIQLTLQRSLVIVQGMVLVDEAHSVVWTLPSAMMMVTLQAAVALLCVASVDQRLLFWGGIFEDFEETNSQRQK